MIRPATVLFAALLACLGAPPACLASAAAQPAEGAVPPSIDHLFDADQVLKWLPDAAGPQFRLGSANPNRSAGLLLEARGRAIPLQQQGWKFWRIAKLPEVAGSRLPNWSAGLFMLADQAGGDPSAALELTVFIRVGQTLASDRAQLALAVADGVMIFGRSENAAGAAAFASTAGAVQQLKPQLPQALLPDHWFGLKLISWQDRVQPQQRHYRLYLDPDPVVPEGAAPRNQWQLFSEYTDLAGAASGASLRSADGRSWRAGVAVYGYRQLDFARLSVRTVIAPQSLP